MRLGRCATHLLHHHRAHHLLHVGVFLVVRRGFKRARRRLLEGNIRERHGALAALLQGFQLDGNLVGLSNLAAENGASQNLSKATGEAIANNPALVGVQGTRDIISNALQALLSESGILGAPNTKMRMMLEDRSCRGIRQTNIQSLNLERTLALGLEDSKQRFLWVIRSPSGVANSSYFDSHSHTDPLTFLPSGYLARTKDRGFVIASWAPQAQILAHSSTGGFLTHCGWNSTMESIVNGVPLIAWPLYAEQKMNAILLTEDIHVALRARAGVDGLVMREEVARVVKGLMEGEEGKGMMEGDEGKRVRNKMTKLKEGACRVMKDDGSFTKALSQLVL